MEERDKIISKLNRLSGLDTFLSVLLYLSDKNLNSFVDELGTRNLKKILNVNELSLLFGFWLKNRNKKSQSALDIEEIGEKVHGLMDELHNTFRPELSDLMSKSYEEIFLTSKALQETIFYSGTGAYDYQYINFIEKEYKYDRDWILTNKNIEIMKIKDFYTFFKEVLNYRINFTSQSRNYEELFKYNKKSFIFEKYPEFKNLIDSFSIKLDEIVNENYNNIGDLNEFSIRPILELEEYYLIPIPFVLAEALNKSPYYWFLEDKNYKNVAQRNRGKTSEEIVCGIMRRAYIEGVHQNVFVKPNKTKTITDLDVCIVDKEVMIIFQIKSKKLTQLSMKGNLNQIKKDYQGAVGDAYNQARMAYNPIIQNNCKLVDIEHKEIINVNDIKEIYTVCIVYDSYPPLTSHTIILNEEEEITPVAMNVFDLEICVEYLKNKSDFVDYVKRRTLYSKHYHAESELSFLKFHLENKLEPKNNATKIMLDNDYAQQFDKDYYMNSIRRNKKELTYYISGISMEDYCFCGSGKQFKNCCLNL